MRDYIDQAIEAHHAAVEKALEHFISEGIAVELEFQPSTATYFVRQVRTGKLLATIAPPQIKVV